MTVAVLAPYTRGETTMAAARLADLAVAQGRDVRLAAAGVRDPGVHPFWDGRVHSDKKQGLYLAARGCAHVVHFGADAARLAAASLVAGDARHVLVVDWHQLTPAALGLLGRYHRVVCPTRACYESLRRHAAPDRIACCPWDSCLPAVAAGGVSLRTRALVYCDRATIDEAGEVTLRLLEWLLGRFADLDLTVLSAKSWSRGGRGRLRHLQGRHPERLCLGRAGDLHEQARHFHAHHWLVLPSPRANFGMVALRALSCGLPVIAHDVAPFNEVVADGVNGVLVRGGLVEYGPLRAPRVVPALGGWVDACAGAFADRGRLDGLRSGPWPLAVRRQNFVRFWREEWSAEGA